MEEDHLNFARSVALREAGYELVPATETIMQLRAAKDAEEVEAVREACVHIEAAYDELWATLMPGMTEAEINARIAFAMMRRGAKHCEPHILFGTHSADSHGTPGERKLEVGDVVVADIAGQFGAVTGATSRAAPPPGRRAMGPEGVGRSCTRRTSTRSRRPGLGNTTGRRRRGPAG